MCTARAAMNIKFALEYILTCFKNNEYRRMGKHPEPVCDELDLAATNELQKEESFKEFITGG